MSATPYPIFLISLARDQARRDALAARFPRYYPLMRQLPAVDGRALRAEEFFGHIAGPVRGGHRLMLPAEVGCSLSHIQALQQFLQSGAAAALVLEDDILGDDEALARVMALIPALPAQGFMICGGQEGMPAARKYLLGKTTATDGLYRLPAYSLRHVFRTCCYVVTRASAEQILQRQQQCLRLADDWAALLQRSPIAVYYSRHLQHPRELAHSHIEQERALFGHKAVFGKRGLPDVLRHRLARVQRKLGALLCWIRGYRRVA